MWMQIVVLIKPRSIRLHIKCLGTFVELLLQLQQFKAASLARFPTATQKRALPRVGDPLRAGLFFEAAHMVLISVPSLRRTGKSFIPGRQ
jgi:hypothetical protein